jgi:acyl-coenzyme A thioesterase PaaI-like protein
LASSLFLAANLFLLVIAPMSDAVRKVIHLAMRARMLGRGGFGKAIFANSNVHSVCSKERTLETLHSTAEGPLSPRSDLEFLPQPASTLLALFDETSSCGLVGFDKENRPGVSLHLELEMMRKDVPIGTTIRVVNKFTKMGKSISFTDVTCIDHNTEEVLARGKHIKYMPMGWIWGLAWSPLLKPITTHMLTQRVDQLGPDQGLREDDGDILSLFSSLEYGNSSSAVHDCRKIHCNPLGKMHGGAIAIAAEQVGSAARGGARPSVARALSLHYLSAVPQGPVCFDADDVSSSRTSPTTQIKVSPKLQGGNVAATATVTWFE